MEQRQSLEIGLIESNWSRVQPERALVKSANQRRNVTVSYGSSSQQEARGSFDDSTWVLRLQVLEKQGPTDVLQVN